MTAGQPARLKWAVNRNVSNPGYNIVSPAVGAIHGTGVMVNPWATTTYEQYATKEYARSGESYRPVGIVQLEPYLSYASQPRSLSGLYQILRVCHECVRFALVDDPRDAGMFYPVVAESPGVQGKKNNGDIRQDLGDFFCRLQSVHRWHIEI